MTPGADQVQADLALVPYLRMDHGFSWGDRQGYFPPIAIPELGGMAAQVQADDKIDLLFHQLEQEVQITELPIQDQRSLSQQVFERFKGPQMVQIV
ncbi:MAG: hypothetical protein ACUVR2_11730 [Anaerolineae bacterium]